MVVFLHGLITINVQQLAAVEVNDENVHAPIRNHKMVAKIVMD